MLTPNDAATTDAQAGFTSVRQYLICALRLACYATLSVLAVYIGYNHARQAGDNGPKHSLYSYADAGQNVTDVFADLIHPQNLQPFWMIPLCNSIKVVVMFALVGFDLPFRPKTPFQWSPKTIVMHLIKTAPLVFLAVNGWSHDMKYAWSILAEKIPFGIRCLLFVDLWVMSSNYASALAIWSSLMIQSPAAALRLTPTYRAWRQTGAMKLPVSPFATMWLRPLKWLYAIVLLPYALPRYVFHSVVVFFACPAQCFWCVCVRCACFQYVRFGCCMFSHCVAKCCCFCFSIPAVIFTFGFCGYANQAFLYWFWSGLARGWPVYYVLFLGLYTAVIVPYGTSILYGFMTCTPWKQIKIGLRLHKRMNDIKKVLEKARKENEDFGKEKHEKLLSEVEGEGVSTAVQQMKFLPEPIKLSKEDISLMKFYAKDDLACDFEGLDDAHNPMDDHRVNLSDSRVRVVYATLMEVVAVTWEQLFYLTITRYLVSVYTGQSTGVLDALSVTLDERSLGDYQAHVSEVFMQGVNHAGRLLYLVGGYI
eukprot:TRINITY_DN24534_c0_g3_i1.p1 TRINITY_DN24534_c0_g3~~TRINITY_DN24534_c0_g3_i1.p1  ORF type:complete len:536 (-),score=51.30 TRINITY_DN24534_c0_g3_i1:139-1746(-)